MMTFLLMIVTALSGCVVDVDNYSKDAYINEGRSHYVVIMQDIMTEAMLMMVWTMTGKK